VIRVRRIYSKSSPDDGYRILVDRLWPRGLSKGSAKVDLWLKDIAPSDKLRKWFSHDPKKWAEFDKKYHNELKEKNELISNLKELEQEKSTITLLFSAKNEECNNAVSLKGYMQRQQQISVIFGASFIIMRVLIFN
jgi:uncharacterized protein YeaO (DUF488 family)